MNYDDYISETERIVQTYRDTHDGQEPAFSDVRFIDWRLLAERERFPTLDHAMSDWTGVVPSPVPSPTPQPIDVWRWPRIGASYYTSLTDPRVDPVEFARRLSEAGCSFTRAWLFDAWAFPQGGIGQYAGFTPFGVNYEGVWDLWKVSDLYIDRIRRYTEAMNAAGVIPMFTGLELYTWNASKQSLWGVPDQNRLWMRRNAQGLRYSGDEDGFFVLGTGAPHDWLGHFYAEVVNALKGLVWLPETGNEMPEKDLHYRLRNLWRASGYTGPVSINRNEDTPGQYTNMKIGKEFELISYHGKRDISYLDTRYERESEELKTFRLFYKTAPSFGRIILSSDGCRKSLDVNDAYDYASLKVVFDDILTRGGSVEHQSRIKLRAFSEGRIDLADLETEWLQSLTR